MNHHTRSIIASPRYSKKEQILGLYTAGARSIGELAALTSARPSYVAQVLRDADVLPGYFDLYTTTDEPMNIYSRLFAKRLGFRTEGIARRSVNYIGRLHDHFAHVGDRAGQHHALVMALTMFNRARWSNKTAQAAIFRDWLVQAVSLVQESQSQQAHNNQIERDEIIQKARKQQNENAK